MRLGLLLLLCMASFGANIEGLIVVLDGTPIPGAVVELQDTTPRVIRSLTTDARGRFVVEDIPNGVYLITVRARGFAMARKAVAVRTDDALQITIGLEVGMTVPGRFFEVSGRIPKELTQTEAMAIQFVAVYKASIVVTASVADGRFRALLPNHGLYEAIVIIGGKRLPTGLFVKTGDPVHMDVPIGLFPR